MERVYITNEMDYYSYDTQQEMDKKVNEVRWNLKKMPKNYKYWPIITQEGKKWFVAKMKK